MKKISRTLVAVAVGAVLPIALASPAQAAEPRFGCTATGQNDIGTQRVGSGVKLTYIVEVKCARDIRHQRRTVRVKQEQWEHDDKRDDKVGPTMMSTHNFYAPGGVYRMKFERPLPATEEKDEELFQRTQFIVSADNTGSVIYTPWEKTFWRRILH